MSFTANWSSMPPWGCPKSPLITIYRAYNHEMNHQSSHFHHHEMTISIKDRYINISIYIHTRIYTYILIYIYHYTVLYIYHTSRWFTIVNHYRSPWVCPTFRSPVRLDGSKLISSRGGHHGQHHGSWQCPAGHWQRGCCNTKRKTLGRSHGENHGKIRKNHGKYHGKLWKTMEKTWKKPRLWMV